MHDKCCTFFGHRTCPSEIKQKLYDVLENLITNEGVKVFYVGNQGSFDKIVCSVLERLSKDYPHIVCTVVLAYFPTENKDNLFKLQDGIGTIYPEGIETAPKRFAIDWRNRWLLKQADYVVTYITHSWGGAAKYAEKAKRLGKRIVNIAVE